MRIETGRLDFVTIDGLFAYGAILAGRQPSEKVLLPAYDDAQGVTAEFNKNILARLNRELDADFDLAAFRHVAVWNKLITTNLTGQFLTCKHGARHLLQAGELGIGDVAGAEVYGNNRFSGPLGIALHLPAQLGDFRDKILCQLSLVIGAHVAVFAGKPWHDRVSRF